MNSTEIKACPTCGSEATLTPCNLKSVLKHWKVKCPTCGSSGPYSSLKDLAINFWNYGAGGKQPAPPEVEDVKALASATGSAAAPKTEGSKGIDWLRLVVMVENTEANRKIAGTLIVSGRRTAELFEGKKIVKCEALQIFGMDSSKEKSPKAEAQPNAGADLQPRRKE